MPENHSVNDGSGKMDTPGERASRMHTPESLPGNTHRLRAVSPSEKEKPKKNLERVTTSDAVQRKKPLGRKIVENFAGEDVENVGSFVLFEVAIPAAKSMISDIVSQGIERWLFGSTHRGGRGSSNSGGSSSNGYTSYNRMHSSSSSSNSRNNPQREMSQRARASHDFRDVIIKDRGEAESILDQLMDLVEEYGVACVSDLYALVGITGSFVDDKYGWTDLRGSNIRRVRDGYLLDLPKTTTID